LQEQNVMTLDAESPELPTAEEAGLSLNELAYRRFKQALVTLSYKPGEYLNTAQVMSELDMGRTPINQAIHRLANEGLLQVIPRKGVMVAPLSMDDALELIEVRLANEMLCMRLASKRITAHQIAELTELNQQIEAASQQRDRVKMMTVGSSIPPAVGANRR
jgi:DNA-binding GntR family transcriptional regulator